MQLQAQVRESALTVMHRAMHYAALIESISKLKRRQTKSGFIIIQPLKIYFLLILHTLKRFTERYLLINELCVY